jgi:hypothetical protein
MPKLDMDGPFDLKNGVIDEEIGKDVIGNFALGFMNKNGKFVVKAVGRSDANLNKDLKSAKRKFSGGFFGQLLGKSKLDKFKYSVAANADSAYQVEQRAFEDFGGPKNLLNKEPPTPPK